VLVPEGAGVLSALGLAASDERRDFVRSYLVPLEQAGELPAEGEAELRYAGQSFELSVPLGPDLAGAFHRAHEERYGYSDPSRPIELVSVRTTEVRAGPTLDRGTAPRTEAAGPDLLELDTTTCWLPPGWVGVRDGKGAGWRLTRS
jgi:N-methylhydantoinase A/oxoprolinase/acetone carboxylase beta subunit